MNMIAYVDESGNFRTNERGLVLAGVGFRVLPPKVRLRAQLRAALPGIPWPCHAAHLNQVCFPLVAHLHSPSNAPQVVCEGAEILRAAVAPEAVAVRAAIRKARAAWKVDQPLLVSLGAWFRGAHPSLYRRLQTHQRSLVGAVNQVLSGLGDQAVVLAAWHGAPAGGARQSYLELTEAWIQRALQVSPRGVALVPAYFPEVDGASVRRPFFAKAFIGRAHHYHQDVHPGLVLGDFVANQLHRILLRSESWSEVIERWPCQLPLRVVTGGATVAAVGAPEVALSLILAGRLEEGADLLAACEPSWVRAQALSWVPSGGAQ